MAMDYSYRRNKLINIYNECGLFADAFVNLSLRYVNRLTGNQLLLRIKIGGYTNQIRSYLNTQLKRAEPQVIRTNAHKIITKKHNKQRDG